MDKFRLKIDYKFYTLNGEEDQSEGTIVSWTEIVCIHVSRHNGFSTKSKIIRYLDFVLTMCSAHCILTG